MAHKTNLSQKAYNCTNAYILLCSNLLCIKEQNLQLFYMWTPTSRHLVPASTEISFLLSSTGYKVIHHLKFEQRHAFHCYSYFHINYSFAVKVVTEIKNSLLGNS